METPWQRAEYRSWWLLNFSGRGRHLCVVLRQRQSGVQTLRSPEIQ